MRTVYKYPFQVADRFTLELPEDFWPLSVQVQDGVPCLWVLMDTEKPRATFTFSVFGTGRPIRKGLDIDGYIGTFQMPPFVWHLFEGGGAP
jgi:hypothetical protein